MGRICEFVPAECLTSCEELYRQSIPYSPLGPFIVGRCGDRQYRYEQQSADNDRQNFFLIYCIAILNITKKLD